jgi:hypothetical protein
MKNAKQKISNTRGIGTRRVLNIKNIKKDFVDPDLKSYGKTTPVVNKAIMKAGLLNQKRKKR